MQKHPGRLRGGGGSGILRPLAPGLRPLGLPACPRTWPEPGRYLFVPPCEGALPLVRPRWTPPLDSPGSRAKRRKELAPVSPSRPGVEARPRGADSPPGAPGQLQGGPLPSPRASRARRGPAEPSPRSVPGQWPPWLAPHRAGGRGRAPGPRRGPADCGTRSARAAAAEWIQYGHFLETPLGGGGGRSRGAAPAPARGTGLPARPRHERSPSPAWTAGGLRG